MEPQGAEIVTEKLMETVKHVLYRKSVTEQERREEKKKHTTTTTKRKDNFWCRKHAVCMCFMSMHLFMDLSTQYINTQMQLHIR